MSIENNISPIAQLGRTLYNHTPLGYSGTRLKLSMNIDFEGFYGRASEAMEYQWVLEYTNSEYKDIIIRSRRFESLDDFAIRAYKEFLNSSVKEKE